jgi:hypothetical protein
MAALLSKAFGGGKPPKPQRAKSLVPSVSINPLDRFEIAELWDEQQDNSSAGSLLSELLVVVQEELDALDRDDQTAETERRSLSSREERQRALDRLLAHQAFSHTDIEQSVERLQDVSEELAQQQTTDADILEELEAEYGADAVGKMLSPEPPPSPERAEDEDASSDDESGEEGAGASRRASAQPKGPSARELRDQHDDAHRGTIRGYLASLHASDFGPRPMDRTRERTHALDAPPLTAAVRSAARAASELLDVSGWLERRRKLEEDAIDMFREQVLLRRQCR